MVDTGRKSLAERSGFEPEKGFEPLTHLAGGRFRPLSHLSASTIIALSAEQAGRFRPGSHLDLGRSGAQASFRACGIFDHVGDASVGESFGPVAEFYDRLMRGIPYRMWVGYYLLLLSHQGVKVREILDVCCGTGAVAELLYAEGFEVEGLDLSEPMIAQARRKAAEKGLPIRYECQDAAEFDMGRTYDAAFSFFDSLNYIVDPPRLASAMRRVAAHVKPGGSWVFDLNTAYAFEAQLFDQRDLAKRSAVRYDWKGHWNPETRVITVEMRFWHEGKEFHETHRQRAYSDDEIREMLADAGFVDVRCFHSYTLDRPRANSDRVHYACIRG